MGLLGRAVGSSSPGQLQTLLSLGSCHNWKTLTLPDAGNQVFAYSLVCC